MMDVIPILAIGGLVVSSVLGIVAWLFVASAMRARRDFNSLARTYPSSLLFLVVEAKIDVKVDSRSHKRRTSARNSAAIKRVRAVKFDEKSVALLGFDRGFFSLSNFDAEEITTSIGRIRVRGFDLNSIFVHLREGGILTSIALAPDRLDRYCSPAQSSLEELAKAISRPN